MEQNELFEYNRKCFVPAIKQVNSKVTLNQAFQSMYSHLMYRLKKKNLNKDPLPLKAILLSSFDVSN